MQTLRVLSFIQSCFVSRFSFFIQKIQKFLQKSYRFLGLAFFSLALAACGSGGGNSSPVGDEAYNPHAIYLPTKLLAALPAGEVTGQLYVYDSQDVEVHTESLSVNESTGEVQAPIFELKRGERYTFMSIFSKNGVDFA